MRSEGQRHRQAGAATQLHYQFPQSKCGSSAAGVSGGVLSGGAAAAAAEGGVLGPAVLQGERFAFCMCNPPFFESLEEAGRNPSTGHAGTEEEMVCPGGEMAFVRRMLEDSFELGDRCAKRPGARK